MIIGCLLTARGTLGSIPNSSTDFPHGLEKPKHSKPQFPWLYHHCHHRKY